MLKGKHVLSYTAGIIDGEGCIGIYQRKKNTKRGISYDLIVALWNTNFWLVQWLKMQFGGSVVPRNRTESYESLYPNRRQQWKWSIAQNKAVEFLKLIVPYLQIKRPQAELAIAFQEKKRIYLKTAESAAILEAERILMRQMNKKGRA